MDGRRVTTLHRAVRLTARSSALLFAAAEVAAAVGPSLARAARLLYLAFMTVHSMQLHGRGEVRGGYRWSRSVSRRAELVQGRRLAHRDCDLRPVYCARGHRVGDGQRGGDDPPAAASGRPGRKKRVIAAMFVGTYAGQMSRSAWYALPGSIVGAAAIADAFAVSIRQRRGR